jgi:hypothetical protein
MTGDSIVSGESRFCGAEELAHLEGASQFDWPRLTTTQAEDEVANEGSIQEVWWI